MATSASVYNYQRTDFLHYIRDQQLPVDLVDVFEQAGVPFFEGCLLVEVHDHRKPTVTPDTSSRLEYARSDLAHADLMYLRDGGKYGMGGSGMMGRSLLRTQEAYPSPNGVEIYRIVLQPTVEALWNDLKSLDTKHGGLWSDEKALQIESKILNLTAPPLCLSPDPHAMRMANLMLSSTMPPHNYPETPTFQRYRRDKTTGNKLNSVELELERSQDARREQIMSMMKGGWATNSSSSNGNADLNPEGPFVPTFSRIEFLRNWRKSRAGAGTASSKEAAATTAKAPEVAAAGTSSAKKKKTTKTKEAPKKPETPAVAASPPDDAANKGRGKTKRRKTEEATSPPTSASAKQPKQAAVYPANQGTGTPKMQQQQAAFNAFGMPQQLPGKMGFDDKSLVLPGGNAMGAQNMLPNNAILPGYGTPTLGMQGLPTAFNSPQTQAPAMPSMDQDQNRWMYS
ncbi:Transcription factor spt20 [Malassezia brasiliensis]|uniref:Transcription factor spt20 n=1 Tax=Malassezia brasiliensis TaxID=1821822 RepID=A0AAF0DUS9_9BASI|nr:Transcription factor spt20 [Malassezia brasiliensis]